MEKTINRHQCFGCCLKHLASALTIAGEISTGYDTAEYHLYLLGNLAEAQEQIATRSPLMANEIRTLRLRLFAERGRARLNDAALRRLEQLARIMQRAADREAAAPPIATKTPRKRGCNCKSHAYAKPGKEKV